MLLRAALDLARDALSPPRCAACDDRIGSFDVLCGPCEIGREPDLTPLGLAVAGRVVPAIAAARYGGPVATAIQRLKFGDRSDLARPLSTWLAEAAGLLGPADLVVPVPLAPGRVVERGYDQASLLAIALASRLALDVRPDALRRARATSQQSRLDRAARLANVEGAFVPGRARRSAEGRRVLLVDDVLTTGATSAAACSALFAGGARAVAVIALARSDRDPDDGGSAAAPQPGAGAPPGGIRQRAMMGT